MKKQLFIFSLLMLVMVNILGGCKMADKKNVTTKEEQIEFLKEHEQEMTEYVKSKNTKITSVQWDWESIEIQIVTPNAGGIPAGSKYKKLSIDGGFNEINDSNFLLSFVMSDNNQPEIESMYIQQTFRVGGKIFNG
ncbi:lipoprotein BUG3 family protein [Lactococcus chungangensis CAU 28 = DSM 22330]|uniref:Lipoprotein BUG3 family protein n=4 Tax=Pseudolactococcus chungangensis TaxID=451457 RepID=A0ABX4IAF5_9LACT|nr:lipoprotein BUG3 family protein [Lactococcus chungangensis CAU 28 = DSM 22330]